MDDIHKWISLLFFFFQSSKIPLLVILLITNESNMLSNLEAFRISANISNKILKNCCFLTSIINKPLIHLSQNNTLFNLH